MAKKARSTPRREESLSRDQIIAAAIELLDRDGAGGLTFRALSESLATGPGAIYWHIDDKSDLLAAACDAVVARTMEEHMPGAKPQPAIRALALSLFDTIDAHPWVGLALTQLLGQSPIVRIIEGLGRQVRALGVPEKKQWAAVSALLSYILGVAGQNAANGQRARTEGLDRTEVLETIAQTWSQLDPAEYSFTRSMAGQLSAHDDRVDFLTGIDLILSGLESARAPQAQPRREKSHASAKKAA